MILSYCPSVQVIIPVHFAKSNWFESEKRAWVIQLSGHVPSEWWSSPAPEEPLLFRPQTGQEFCLKLSEIGFLNLPRILYLYAWGLVCNENPFVFFFAFVRIVNFVGNFNSFGSCDTNTTSGTGLVLCIWSKGIDSLMISWHEDMGFHFINWSV